MRTLAIILNLAIIVFFVLVLFTGNVALNEKFFIPATLFTTAALVNLYYILNNPHNSRENKGWLSLYFKRKAMEEKAKINELSKTKETD